MLYRKLGKTNKKVSVLGLGTKQLPLNNISASDELIKFAIDNGINYIDIVYSKNESNINYLGDFFNRNPNYREKVLISTTINSDFINNKSDFDDYFKKQIESLKLNTVDFYLIEFNCLDDWKKLVKYGILDFLDKSKNELTDNSANEAIMDIAAILDHIDNESYQNF